MKFYHFLLCCKSRDLMFYKVFGEYSTVFILQSWLLRSEGGFEGCRHTFTLGKFYFCKLLCFCFFLDGSLLRHVINSWEQNLAAATLTFILYCI